MTAVLPERPQARERDRGTDWSAQAACADDETDIFFPVGMGIRARATFEQARVVCSTCPVSRQCLEFAILVDAEYGMWGGTTPEERRRIKRRLGRRRRHTTKNW